MNAWLILVSLVVGFSRIASRHSESAGPSSILSRNVPLLRNNSRLHTGPLNRVPPSDNLVKTTTASHIEFSNVSSEIFSRNVSSRMLSSDHAGYAGNASSRNIFCTLVPRAVPSLPAKFMSSTPPFAEPRAKDYLGPKEGGGTTFLMRQVDVDILEQRKYMLNKVTALLDKHHVTYWLEAGTLLGAYRSQAFSPWDDDIDLSVPISFQKTLLGPIKQDLAAVGIVIHQLYFPPGNPYYKPLGTYIRHHAPRVAATSAGNATWGTLGYFCQAWYKGLKLDLWQAIPVELDGKVLYATGVGGHVLFSRRDVFPLGHVTFEGQSYPIPHRAHRYLVGIYDDISMPPWQHWYDPYTCTWKVLYSELKKKPRDAKSKHFATLTFDSQGVPHMDVPECVKDEVDTPATFKKYELGGQDAVVSNTPSGHGYPAYRLGR